MSNNERPLRYDETMRSSQSVQRRASRADKVRLDSSSRRSPLMTWTRPDAGAIRKALVRYAPWLAAEPIEFLGEGWSCWTFRAGDHALRFPKRESDCAEFDKDRRLLPELARHVSLPIPVPDVYGEAGPNSAPFAGHKLLPGESLITAKVLLT